MVSNKTEMAENVVLGALEVFGVHRFLVGLHNASAHGKCFKELDLDIEDTQLVDWFEHINALCLIAESVED